MKRLLSLLLPFALFACRENPSPESQAVTTAAAETTSSAPATSAAPAAPSVQGPKLQPIDEATNDPSLVAFRDQLLAAVRRRDADAVVALADPKIRTSFGDGGGAEDFRQSLTHPGTWEDFEQLLTLGGKFQGESFWAPYVYSAWPDSHDAFEFLAVIGENVPLRETADANANAIATLSHDIVQRDGEPQGSWQKIKTADGKSGFVEKKSVRSPVGYRAGFLKVNGVWKINALVAGD